jgi:hypothetical protein
MCGTQGQTSRALILAPRDPSPTVFQHYRDRAALGIARRKRPVTRRCSLEQLLGQSEVHPDFNFDSRRVYMPSAQERIPSQRTEACRLH